MQSAWIGPVFGDRTDLVLESAWIGPVFGDRTDLVLCSKRRSWQ
jgi:hypothetical protein